MGRFVTDANQESEASGPQTGEQPPAMPRWVKVSVVVAAAVLLVLVVLRLTGTGGQHGPARHQSAGQQPGYLAALSTDQSGSGR